MKPIVFFVLTLFLSACSDPERNESDAGSRPPVSKSSASASAGDAVPSSANQFPELRPADAQISPFLGRTYQEVVTASAAAGSGLDGEMALGYAEELCELNLEETSASATSKDDLTIFKARFCADRHGKADLGSRFGAVDRAAEAGDAEAEVLQLALSAGDDLTADELQLISSELSSLTQRTTSPYIYQTANELLYSEPFYDVTADRERPAGMNDERLMLARQYGTALAACERFRHCGPNSLLAKRACMPTQCAPGQDMNGYIRKQLPEAAYLEALRFSRTLLGNQRS